MTKNKTQAPSLKQYQNSKYQGPNLDIECKDPGPEDPALISPQRGGVYLRLPME
ncbi:hypothetical protein D1AOALGA4SA_321 [Olavius algarvensis Delta 1 endosymbiont]|nr:hypothetical protein D1AOALGA4SA_321 [Olavius algarvensis Delta 1 endosymbiont]